LFMDGLSAIPMTTKMNCGSMTAYAGLC